MSTQTLYGVRLIYPHGVSRRGKPLKPEPLSFSGSPEGFPGHLLLEAGKLSMKNKVDG